MALGMTELIAANRSSAAFLTASHRNASLSSNFKPHRTA